MIRSNFGFRLKYKSRTMLNALIAKYGGNGIYDIKGEKSIKEKNALFIYTAEAVSKYLSKTLPAFTHLSSHSGFHESIEALHLLLELGYTVDYLNLIDTPAIDWSKYELIIDAGSSLENSKHIKGQKKIYYATGCHWKTFYANAYKHSESFYKRNNILLYPDRQLIPNYSDEAADLITCFGGSYQADSFQLNRHKVKHLNISTTYIPPKEFRKKIGTKTKFMWYGGHGPFHKGLDIVVEAFEKMPQFELHIFGNIELNAKLYNWFQDKIQLLKNISYHGWATPDSKTFQEYVQLCDAFVFASSSEGGAGSVIQCLQFGLIPILNASTSVDLTNQQFNIQGKNPEEEIASIIETVERFSKTNSEELQVYSDNLAKYYSSKHTIALYAESLKSVICL